MLSTIAEIIRDLLIFVGVITALLVSLVVVVSKMPNTNPLKRRLTVSLTKTIKAAQAPIRAFVLLGTELSMAFARLACRRNDSGRSQAASSSSSALASFRSRVLCPSVNQP